MVCSEKEIKGERKESGHYCDTRVSGYNETSAPSCLKLQVERHVYMNDTTIKGRLKFHGYHEHGNLNLKYTNLSLEAFQNLIKTRHDLRSQDRNYKMKKIQCRVAFIYYRHEIVLTS